jgi:hypothetical protein
VAIEDPASYLRALAQEQRRLGWAEWIEKNLDGRSVEHLAANLARHPALPRMLKRVLPDLPYDTITYLLSLEGSMQGNLAQKARGGRDAVRGRGKQSAGVAWKVGLAGGPEQLRGKVAVARRIVAALSDAVLDEAALRRLLNDPELQGIASKAREELMAERLAQETTMSVGELVDVLGKAEARSDRELRALLFGFTPMCLAVHKADNRFRTLLRPHDGAGSALVIVSDGQPSDGDPRPLLQIVRDFGVLVISCYVTDCDVQEARSLAAQAGGDWSEGARLLFECASAATADLPQTRFLVERGWTVPPDARFFAQVNHSAILSEFLQSAIG